MTKTNIQDPGEKYKGRDISSWPTKKEVASRLGRSLAAVVRLQVDGKLNPVEDDDGHNRYPPEEVDEVCKNPPKAPIARTGKEDLEDYQLDFAKAVLDLVRSPREKIDELQFKMIDRLVAENERLKKQLDDQTIEIERARDRAAERTLGLNEGMSQLRVRELATTKFIEGLSRFLTGGKDSGVSLTVEQLEELLLVENFFTAEQQQKAKASVMAGKAKGVIGDAAKAVIANTATTSKDEKPTEAPSGT